MRQVFSSMSLFALNKKGIAKETREDYEQEIIFIIKEISPDLPSYYKERNTHSVGIKIEGENLESSRTIPKLLTVEEARKLWKELKNEGCKQVTRYSKFKIENEKLHPWNPEEDWEGMQFDKDDDPMIRD